MIPGNPHIQGAFFKALGYLNDTKNIVVSVSGGSDSDIITDFIHQCGYTNRVKFVFIDTGLEYQATKEHLNYLENRYKIQIDRIKAYRSIPLCCKEYGQPFISKVVSDNIERLQKHGFKWENKPFNELIKEYPNCKSALKWWTNSHDRDNLNISYKKFLKEFLIENPPDFKISAKCCEYAKKKTVKKYYKENNTDIVITGLRRSEGGARATSITSCYTTSTPDKYRPIWWLNDDDKREYAKFYGVKYSRCYSEYGFKRTGCAGCPFSLALSDDLDKTARHEPKLYRAVMSVFGKSYEYTDKYYKFRADLENQHAREIRKTPALDLYGGIA